MLKIFLYVLERSWRLNHEDPCTTLVLVCTFWRDVVYGSKLMWSKIDLTNIGMARRHLEMASGVPLDVYWSPRAGTSFPVQVFLEHVATTASLSIYDLESLQHLDGIEFPILRKFSCMSDVGEPQVLGGPGPLRMPALESVVI